MNIISWQFGLFVLAVVVIYHLLPRSYKRIWLLIASYAFYFFIDWRYLLVLSLLTVINYFLAKNNVQKNQKRYFFIAETLNLLSFGLLKWLTSPYSMWLGFESGQWIMPIGFSFYILQLLSFQTDINSRKIDEFPSLLNFSVYMAYFPKILSGPIEKPIQFFRKLNRPLILTNEIVSNGFGLIFNGLIRKVIIANLLKILVAPIGSEIGSTSWLSIFAFSFQLYNDFLGYTDIVRGISLFFGIELSANFRQPYLARNLSEFWSGWHITLTTWLRETIFFPLSRDFAQKRDSINSILGGIIPPLATMVASGFWHGATVSMLFWGVCHGFYLILERLIYTRWPNLRPARLGIFGQFFSSLMTFMVVTLTWIPFSSPGFNQSIRIMQGLITRPELFGQDDPILPILLIVLSVVFDIVENRTGDELWWQRLPLSAYSIGLAISVLLLAAAFIFQIQAPVKTFIYQGF